MSRITEGHLARHYQGLRGGRDAALLDIAQDHALRILHDRGLFDLGLVFKGGTALRKFRAGNAGRFSTDLDFARPTSLWRSPYWMLWTGLRSTDSPSRSATLMTTVGEAT